jgi:hypothetical protein
MSSTQVPEKLTAACADVKPATTITITNVNPLLLPLLDLNDLIEISFLIKPARLDLTLDHRVVRCIDILVKSGGNLFHPEWRQEPIVVPILQ